MDTLINILADTSIILSIVIGVLSLINFRKSKTGLKIMLVMLIMSACSEITSSYYAAQGIHNMFVLHIFTFFEFLLVGCAFQSIFKQYKKDKKLTASIIFGAILILLNSIFIQDLSTFNSYSYTFDSLFIIIASLYYFTIILEYPTKQIAEKTTLAIVIYLFVFHSVDLIFFCFINEIMEVSKESAGHLQGFRAYVLLLMRVYILYFLVLYSKSTKTA